MRRVVITGMGIVSPVGNTVDEFWGSLKAGVCGVGAITKAALDGQKVHVAAEVKGFDPQAYFAEKSDIRKTDLFVQYAMAAAVQAMTDSGLNHAGEESPWAYDPNRFGVYIGSGIGGMNTFVNETIKLKERGPSRVSPHFIPMMIGNMASGMVAIRFGAKGPTLPVVTACATSSNAIGEAFRAIRHDYADVILAGGAEAAINPLALAGFTNCMALSESSDPNRASIPFDKERGGFVMGEGAGVVVLEDMEHAKARHARIYAEVAGYGNTCDAYHVTAPHPEADGAARAIRLALDEAGITRADRLYLNAHGTGTPLNDSAETLAIKKALGMEWAKDVLVSSTKSMTGHMLGAAGAAEVIASALALQEGIVPPTINFRVPDELCDLDIVPNTARKAEVTAALSNSLGFGGHNACVALKKI